VIRALPLVVRGKELQADLTKETIGTVEHREITLTPVRLRLTLPVLAVAPTDTHMAELLRVQLGDMVSEVPPPAIPRPPTHHRNMEGNTKGRQYPIKVMLRPLTTHSMGTITATPTRM
jgi:hypothetical protein